MIGHIWYAVDCGSAALGPTKVVLEFCRRASVTYRYDSCYPRAGTSMHVQQVYQLLVLDVLVA